MSKDGSGARGGRARIEMRADSPRPGRPVDRCVAYAEPADYDRATGGYVYNTRIVERLEHLGWQVERMRLPVIFPQPTPETLARTTALIAAVPSGTPVLIDQVCLSRLLGIAARERERIRWVEIFHHPMVADLAPDDPARDTIAGNEREALALARLVIATSHATARWLGEHGIARQRLVTARPGLDRFTPRSGPGAPGPLRLLSVGAVVPRKDYIRLIGALAHVAEQPDWRLDIVGNPDRDPAYAAKVRAMIDQCGLAARITLRGRLEDADLAELWAGADVYVAASRHEGYGMAVAEAVGRGIPIVTTAAGAVAEWLSPDCAMILPDGGGLAEAIAQILADPVRRQGMGRAATAVARGMSTWDESAEIVSRALLGMT